MALLQASLLLAQKQPRAARAALDAAAAHSFAVKAWPQWHVLRGEALLALAEVCTEVNTAIQHSHVHDRSCLLCGRHGCDVLHKQSCVLQGKHGTCEADSAASGNWCAVPWN